MRLSGSTRRSPFFSVALGCASKTIGRRFEPCTTRQRNPVLEQGFFNDFTSIFLPIVASLATAWRPNRFEKILSRWRVFPDLLNCWQGPKLRVSILKVIRGANYILVKI